MGNILHGPLGLRSHFQPHLLCMQKCNNPSAFVQVHIKSMKSVSSSAVSINSIVNMYMWSIPYQFCLHWPSNASIYMGSIPHLAFLSHSLQTSGNFVANHPILANSTSPLPIIPGPNLCWMCAMLAFQLLLQLGLQ